MDLSDSPEQARYRETVRAWLRGHRDEAPLVRLVAEERRVRGGLRHEAQPSVPVEPRRVAAHPIVVAQALLGLGGGPDVPRGLRLGMACQVPVGERGVRLGQIRAVQERPLEELHDLELLAFGLAFLFIYMVLASQFESFKHPLTIMVSLPLALIGALLALVFTGHHLSMGAMIGSG